MRSDVLDRPQPAREKVRFIFNPRSGRLGRSARVLPRLRRFVAAYGPDAEIAVTEGPGHATVLAREAAEAGFTRVAAVGGDGTVNEIGRALLHTPAALAFVPCGSGNGLAWHLRIPRSLEGALELAAGGTRQTALIDTGTANGLPFFNVMGAGFDAEVSLRFNRLKSRGLASYVGAVVGAFRSRVAQRWLISGPDRNETLEALMVTVANSDQFGNGARVAPGALTDDGLLDLVVVSPVSIAGSFLLGARLFLGSFHCSSHVRRRRGKRFVIRRDEAGPIHTDGEDHPADATIEALVHPASLRVVVGEDSPVGARGAGAKAGFLLQFP